LLNYGDVEYMNIHVSFRPTYFYNLSWVKVQNMGGKFKFYNVMVVLLLYMKIKLVLKKAKNVGKI
jgi:hypothetical protein